MSEAAVATGSDVAGAAPPGNGVSTGAAQAAQPAPRQAKAEAPKPEWTDKDDEALLAALKRSPYRLKVHGKESAIDSKDALLAALADAQRARGASEVVAKAKREVEEAQALRAQAQEVLQRLEAARKGDVEALRALGLGPDGPEEVDESALPEAVRRQLAKAREAEAKLREYETAQQRREREEKEAATRKQREAILEKARKLGEEALAQVQEAERPALLPHVIDAMRDLQEAGAELGVQVTDAHVVALARRRAVESAVEAARRLQPEVAVEAVAPLLSKAQPQVVAQAVAPVLASWTPTQMREALGKHFEAVARVVARAHLEALRLARAPQQQQPSVAQPEKSPPRNRVLSPFRW